MRTDQGIATTLQFLLGYLTEPEMHDEPDLATAIDIHARGAELPVDARRTVAAHVAVERAVVRGFRSRWGDAYREQLRRHVEEHAAWKAAYERLLDRAAEMDVNIKAHIGIAADFDAERRRRDQHYLRIEA